MFLDLATGFGGVRTTLTLCALLKQPIKPDHLEAVVGVLPAHLAGEMGGAVKIPVLYSIGSDKQTCSGEAYTMEYVKIIR